MARLLEREIGQRKPLSLVDQAAANLHRSSAVLLQEVAAYLAGYELSPKQYNILRILRGAGKNGLCCSDIAARLVTPDPDITRLLDRLAKKKGFCAPAETMWGIAALSACASAPWDCGCWRPRNGAYKRFRTANSSICSR